MKKLMWLLPSLLILFCLASCHHNEEPPVEVKLPIADIFIPATVTFDFRRWRYVVSMAR